ncbi:MAG: Hsp70 family protein, partial [Oscillospiraceae bacterium]|nr:Hsp70 family protein [Oscillospiraceae bacterium]
PAPRGVPQIEVTFDIDANGIVLVSAKDLGTGKEQNIVITASTNMSNDDIDRAVREAEQFAEEDKKRKDAVDTKNNGEQLVFQCEKAMKEFGDKVSDSDKAPIESAVNDLKEALKTDDTDQIKAKTDALQQAFYALSEKVYKQAAPQDGAQQSYSDMGGSQEFTGNNGGKDDGVVDADFTDVN